MSSTIRDIPELSDQGVGLIRIPPETDVPLTGRVRSLIDTRAFRRLSQISQLGLVSLVYPAAHHSRFEHSLGVYRNALLYLRQLSHDPRFVQAVPRREAERFIVASLLHDIGHWPFCHPIEDLQLPEIPRHEVFAAEFIEQPEVADILRNEWQLEPPDVLALLKGDQSSESSRILVSLLSGPIDVDKMDYLARDSLHAGVPYGRNFDQSRLISSLCLNQSGDTLAIRDKGRTAAELMVFARYVMFSEVYWHHAVRAATAMLQRAFYSLHDRLDLKSLFRESEQHVVDALVDAGAGTPVEPLVTGLFGPRRRLHKRLEQYSLFQHPEIYQRLARRPYAWLVRCGESLAARISEATGEAVLPEQILIDAPPQKREVEIEIDVCFPKEGRCRSLAEVSPVVQTLASRQFDDYVKRVRVFVDPSLMQREISDIGSLLCRAIEDTGE